jgi:hypothetical protein
MPAKTILHRCLPLYVLLVSSASSGGAENERLNLRFVDDLRVVVGSIPSDLRTTGMRSHLLKAEMESVIRAAGIEVNEESQNRLEVGIAGIRARNDGFYVFSLRVKLAQPVVPLRVAKEIESLGGISEGLDRKTLLSYTWDSGATGYFRLYTDPAHVIREALRQKVDEFVDDFLVVKQERKISSLDELSLREKDGEVSRSPLPNRSSDGVQLISIKNEGAAIVVYDATGNAIHRTALSPEVSTKAKRTRTDLPDSLSQLGRSLSTVPLPPTR